MNRRFFIATEDEIKNGEITDVYFLRDIQILKSKGIQKPVFGETHAAKLPNEWPWAVFAGVEELARLFEGIRVDVDTLDEGTLFRSEDVVLTVAGIYTDFAVYETSMLGLICQASGIATRAA